MRRRLRVLLVLIGFSFRAAPRQATVLFACQTVAELAALAALYGTKLFIDGIAQGDVERTVITGALIGLAEGISYICRRVFALSREVEERASLLLEQRLMMLTTSIAGIEHHERPEFSNQMALLTSRRGLLARMSSAIVYGLRSGLQLTGAIIMLGYISPWLLLLAPLSVVVLATGHRANAILRAAREASAERRSLRRSLFQGIASGNAGKELRVFGLGDEFIGRHEALARQVAVEELRATWKAAAVELLGSLIVVAGFLGTVAFVFWRAISGAATAGDVLLTLRVAGQLNSAVSMVTGTARYLLQAIKTTGRYI